MFCLLVHREISAEDLEDESADLSRRSDKEQGRRYQAKVKNMHNIVWHQCAANILWEERKVMRNLPFVLLLLSAPLGAFPVNSSEASGYYTVKLV